MAKNSTYAKLRSTLGLRLPHFRPSADLENKMDSEITALLQAYGAALAAIFATHHDPERLRSAFETIANESPDPHPIYAQALQTLRESISGS